VPIVRALPALAAALTVLAGCGGSDAAPDPVVILDTKKVERAIEDSIRSARSITADVDCPSGVHQGEGLTFRCAAKTRRGTTVFVVEQMDDKGSVEYTAR
jgi:hypothetical protein